MNENFSQNNISNNIETLKEEQQEFLSLQSVSDEIEKGNVSVVIENLSEGKYNKLDHQDIVHCLIEKGHRSSVVYYLDKFQGLDHQDIANLLIEKGIGFSVANNLDKFQELNQDIAHRLIEKGHEYYVAQNLDKFQGLDQDIANRLIEKGRGNSVAENLEKFQGLNHQDIANRLIKKGIVYSVVENLEKFQGLDHQSIAHRLIEKGRGNSVVENLEKFQGLDHQNIAYRLIEKGRGNSVASNLEKFQGLDYQDIVNRLIEKGRGNSVVFNLDKFQGLDHQDIAIRLIEKEYGSYVADNLDKFQNLSLERFLSSPPICESFSQLESFIPEIASKISLEFFLEFIVLSDLEKKGLLQSLQENPFLTKTIEENKYATKLILKYPKLDQPSQENISFLYRIKEENDDKDPSSTEFRMQVQEKLYDYKNNKDITSSLEKEGVNMENWLNYDRETMFDLGKEQEISTVKNIRQILEKSRPQPFSVSVSKYLSYMASIVDTKFKKDLQGKTLSEDVISLKEELQIKQMEYETTEHLLQQEQSKNKEEQDEDMLEKLQRRLQGIEKHKMFLEQRKHTPRSVLAYDRIRGDVVLVSKSFEKFSSSLEIYSHLDDRLYSLQELVGPEHRKQRIEIKKEQKEQERIVRESFQVFELRIESLEEKLGDVLEKVLDKEAKESFFSSIQERNSSLEDRDHIHSDMHTVHTLLESEEKTSLEGTPMSLGLWNRNPDEDLYLGNYTDCCIRIDSEHMGEESTIADYLTDVGMQVVIIRDEKKDIPVVAAWLWIGKNKKTGEIALVVDNIEAHTDYSIPYQDQLKEQLRIYLETYAKNIGIKKIVQGKDNNDITVFGKKGKYKKLGGYNREDGYFLEAE